MKKIVIYFSASGITEKRARELAAVTGGYRTGTTVLVG